MSTNPTPMQFDNAEYGQGPSAPTGVACAACKRSIVDQYYEAASQVFCGTCAAMLQAGPQGGSRIWRTIEALILGTLGGVIGAVIWYLIWKFTGYQLGLIAILVGLFVGGGVRKGSRGRGGWFYQLMAMGLTYLAIVSTFVPPFIEEWNKTAISQHENTTSAATKITKLSVLRDGTVLVNGSEASMKDWKERLAETSQENGTVFLYDEAWRDGRLGDPMVGEINDVLQSSGLPWAQFEDAEFSKPHYLTLDREGIHPAERILGYGIILLGAFVAPVFSITESIMGFIIVAIALYEAWKINKKPVLTITGPFMLSPTSGLGAASVVHVPPPAASLPPPVIGDPPQGPTPS